MPGRRDRRNHAPELKAAIIDAHRQWREVMDGVWKRQIEQIDARLAAEKVK